jgi:cytoplasmic iron level regulating protein YaaA (DUF328/UPF0246 family)
MTAFAPDPTGPVLLLPPSETKRPDPADPGDARLAPDTLAFADTLGETRRRLIAKVAALSARPDARTLLRLTARQAADLPANRALGDRPPVLPALMRYTGVLYDALDRASLPGPAVRWLERSVLVQTALLGLVAGGDGVPAHRLSAGVPARVLDLVRLWRPGQTAVLAGLAERSVVVDLRSKAYARLGPLPAGAGSLRLVVRELTPIGLGRPSGHADKAVKGRFVRALALRATADQSTVRDRDAVLALLDASARDVGVRLLAPAAGAVEWTLGVPEQPVTAAGSAPRSRG